VKNDCGHNKPDPFESNTKATVDPVISTFVKQSQMNKRVGPFLLSFVEEVKKFSLYSFPIRAVYISVHICTIFG
jgi:hypothetical protein